MMINCQAYTRKIYALEICDRIQSTLRYLLQSYFVMVFTIILKSKTRRRVSWSRKYTNSVLLFKISALPESVSCHLLLRMARIEMGWNLKKLDQTFSSFNVMPTKITKKLLWLVLSDENCSYLLYNSTGAFCVWVKALSNDLSTILN